MSGTRELVEQVVARYTSNDPEELAGLVEPGVHVPPPPDCVAEVRIDPTEDDAVWFFTVGDGRAHRVELRDGLVVDWA